MLSDEKLEQTRSIFDNLSKSDEFTVQTLEEELNINVEFIELQDFTEETVACKVKVIEETNSFLLENELYEICVSQNKEEVQYSPTFATITSIGDGNNGRNIVEIHTGKEVRFQV